MVDEIANDEPVILCGLDGNQKDDQRFASG
jgi:hypothetical protein